jgi:hypothetical protein
MLEALFDRPDAAVPPLAEDIFARFLGSWRVANRLFTPSDGEWHANSARWDFARILEGRGVQDVLTGDAGVWGTTVRTWDDAAGWHVVWFCPRASEHCVLAVAETSAQTIDLVGVQADGRRIRWSFSALADDSFAWDGWCSDDGGATWWHEQHMDAERIPAAT